jgi:hypothetical protein
MEPRVFMNEDGLATFKCPKCQNLQTKDIGKFDKIDQVKRIKCTCSCGNTFTVIFEKRKFFRRDIELVGRYKTRSKDDKEIRGTCTIIDVSQSGLLFTTNVKHDLEIGDQLEVEFYIDEEQTFLVLKKGVIRRIIDRNVGIEFNTTQHLDRYGWLFIR